MSELPSNDNVKSDAGKPSSADDIADFLAEGDKPAPKTKPEGKAKADKEDGDNENEENQKDKDEITLIDKDEDEEALDLKEKNKDDEEDEEKEDDDEEKDEEIEIDAPPKKKALLKDFPDLFKKHPFLEKMLYRDREYTQLFGSFDDAKDIATAHKENQPKLEIANRWEQELLSGKTDNIIKTVKDTDSKAFDKIVDDYLPALARVDEKAYYEVVGNVVKKLIAEMVTESKVSEDDELRAAALAINKFLFHSSTYTPPTKRVVEDIKSGGEADETAKERQAFMQERFDTARVDLQSKVDNILKATINQYIDPRDSMSPFTKKNAVREALEEVHKLLGKDSSLRSNLDKLWRGAFVEKYSKGSLDKIQSAYLGKAKGTLAVVIKKIRAEALKDSSPAARKNEQVDEEEETPKRETRTNAGRPSQQKSKRNQMEKGESVTDFFARD